MNPYELAAEISLARDQDFCDCQRCRVVLSPFPPLKNLGQDDPFIAATHLSFA